VTTLAEIILWGSRIGAVALGDDSRTTTFQYDRKFSQSGIQVSPLEMPLSNQSYSFPELSRESFHGLPGLLSDSLPDKFGNALINRWLARSGRTPSSFNAVERLCYTGNRGMGALEFVPVTGPKSSKKKTLCVEDLVRIASEILSNRKSLNSSLSDEGLKDILRVGTSAGGARAKAVIAWNPETNQVSSGQINAGDGFQYWLLKFDGINNNKDKELNDPKGYGIIEYAYSLMAKSCGIEMSECRLFKENGRSHFMTKRFDRLPDGDKLHMQSLAALAHFDFNLSGAYGYEQVFHIMRKLNLPYKSIEQQFRRMVFNIVARNQDDHVKNIAFLMNREGQWALSPAFDVNYSYQPDGTWTAKHQMTMNGKQESFTSTDLKECAGTAGMKQGQWRIILEQVQSVVSRWKDFADEAGVPARQKHQIQKTLRLTEFL
jgi:serine/threonine-protein kinase HipA